MDRAQQLLVAIRIPKAIEERLGRPVVLRVELQDLLELVAVQLPLASVLVERGDRVARLHVLLDGLPGALGDQLRAATGKNPTGFFEDKDLLRIGKEVRSRLGLRSESVALVPERSWRETDLADLRKEAVGLLADRFGAVPVWGFKYSQTLRFP